jgi:hypothetical protein
MLIRYPLITLSLIKNDSVNITKTLIRTSKVGPLTCYSGQELLECNRINQAHIFIINSIAKCQRTRFFKFISLVIQRSAVIVSILPESFYLTDYWKSLIALDSAKVNFTFMWTRVCEEYKFHEQICKTRYHHMIKIIVEPRWP